MLQVARGAGLSGLIAGGLLTVGLVSGLSGGSSAFVFIAVAIAGFVFGVTSYRNGALAGIGCLSVTGLGMVSGLTTGFGWLETVTIAGGVLGTVWILSGPIGSLSVPLGVGAALALAVVALSLVPLIVGGETLGHDESAYALKARAWLEGTPDTGWTIHRGPALSGLGYLILAVGGEEAALRSIGVVAVLALAGGTWWLGERLVNRQVGAVAALVVVASPSLLRRATEYLTDIPAAALLVLCMMIVWKEFAERDDGPSYRLMWLLPAAWAAFYLRYQAVLAFGLIGVTILILWWPKVRTRPGPLIATSAVGFAGLVPHFLYSIAETGSPIGILQFTSRIVGREYLGEGLVDYAIQVGWPLFGLLGLPVVGFFMWWVVEAWRNRLTRQTSLFLAIPALGQVLALGVLTHGEPRFIFFPMSLVAIGATAGGIGISERWTVAIRRGVRLALLSLLVGSMALSIAGNRRSVENRILSNEPVEFAADWVGEASAGAACAVMTSYTPQVTFYSGCWTDVFRTGIEARAAVEALRGDARYMILIEDGKRQPSGEAFDDLVAETEVGPIIIEGERDDAEVYRFSDS